MLLKSVSLGLCLLGVAVHGHAAEASFALTVGDTTLQAPVPDGYVRASEYAPAWFAGTAAALPPAARLVETMVARSDVKRMAVGQAPDLPYLQIQVLRDAERVDFTAADWTALQPLLQQQFGGLDPNRIAHSQQGAMGERMSAATGAQVEVTYGEMGKPAIYDTRPTSLHYTLRLPITAQVDGRTQTLDVEAAGSAMLVGSKMVMANAYAPARPGQAPFAASRALVEPFVQRMQSLNAVPGAGEAAD